MFARKSLPAPDPAATPDAEYRSVSPVKHELFWRWCGRGVDNRYVLQNSRGEPLGSITAAVFTAPKSLVVRAHEYRCTRRGFPGTIVVTDPAGDTPVAQVPVGGATLQIGDGGEFVLKRTRSPGMTLPKVARGATMVLRDRDRRPVVALQWDGDIHTLWKPFSSGRAVVGEIQMTDDMLILLVLLAFYRFTLGWGGGGG